MVIEAGGGLSVGACGSKHYVVSWYRGISDRDQRAVDVGGYDGRCEDGVMVMRDEDRYGVCDWRVVVSGCSGEQCDWKGRGSGNGHVVVCWMRRRLQENAKLTEFVVLNVMRRGATESTILDAMDVWRALELLGRLCDRRDGGATMLTASPRVLRQGSTDGGIPRLSAVGTRRIRTRGSGSSAVYVNFRCDYWQCPFYVASGRR